MEASTQSQVLIAKSQLDYIIQSYKNAFENERSPIEMVAIFFYTGKTLNNIKKKFKFEVNKPYESKLVDYLCENFELIDRNNLEKLMKDTLETDLDITFVSYLLAIEKHVKLIYKETIENNLSQNKKYLFDYQLLSIRDIFDFIVYYEYKQEIAHFLQSTYSQTGIEYEHILEIFDSTIKTKNASEFGYKLEDFLGKKDISKMLKNICTNLLDTPFSKVDLVDTHYNQIIEFLNLDSKAKYTDEFIKATNLISEVGSKIKKIVKERIQSIDELEQVYHQVSLEQIRLNKLNISDFVEKLLYECYQNNMWHIKLEMIEKQTK